MYIIGLGTYDLLESPIAALTVMQYMGQPNVLEIIEGLTELTSEER